MLVATILGLLNPGYCRLFSRMVFLIVPQLGQFPYSGVSLPSFFAAILIAWLFAYVLAEYTGLNMFGSLYTVDDFGNGEYLDLKNLILPAFTLAIRPLAIITELTRSSMLDALSGLYPYCKVKGFATLENPHKTCFKKCFKSC